MLTLKIWLPLYHFGKTITLCFVMTSQFLFLTSAIFRQASRRLLFGRPRQFIALVAVGTRQARHATPTTKRPIFYGCRVPPAEAAEAGKAGQL